MTVYDKATLALREALKSALDSNVDDNILSELWRHYLGVQSITRQLKDTAPNIEFNFSISDTSTVSTDYWDPDCNVNYLSGAAAADTIAFNTYGNDVITFS